MIKTIEKPVILTLNPDEIDEINGFLEKLAERYKKADEDQFIRNASIYAHLLPERVKFFLNEFRLSEDKSACVIRGYPIDNNEIGLTPSHWKESSVVKSTVKQEILFVLYSSIIGDIFGWSTEQDGKLIQDILPIKGDEKKQLNSASEELICWHTEDSFQTYAPEFLGLFCLKNFEKAATTFASINSIEINDKHKKILFEKRFIIKPDNAHQIQNNTIVNDFSTPKAIKTSVLFGSKDAPYLRIDPYFMDRTQETSDEKEALDHLIEEFNKVIVDVVLQPGDAFFVDNFRAIHGRKPFYAKYNGDDRWLKRVRIARDLRKSRSQRNSENDRIIK
ncbi:guanitoxin biosynthesis L-enduracididine beta-hydroxylase GntD [Bacillus chungangensis]|uniref:Fe(II)/alpha-ketoglutarate-dependent arginine beta-hydroxylase n=1 Tax=Bacillus chungangensis TaxID=587633 RepID=A0ABT9WQ93_9BACI|nr:guanitoxin biosynthesis L-enduracididine beta-hydroxylase GntD [Bacillus chungangensis]MDQ0174945.1 Fe(II)/alpha-ketoglutarate-dependent arginine beta-hydroxylase [Bacillus chungangensis]